MDDSCAVCTESLDWVAYGTCGHKEVCSICVARLRFICDDRQCCICKTESNVVFITKALGKYTNIVKDLPLTWPKEGCCGPYWYHEGTQAFFDDADHYKTIKARCNLSCSECDKRKDNKPKLQFRNIDHLKRHLFDQHKLFMCQLCLGGRKVFICEQKLYTRGQLKRHTSSGDSVVDRSGSEMGRFEGHPWCNFCKSGFYGESELYTHMNTDHEKCTLCSNNVGGKIEYYKNHDDLINHFRGCHYLCENESCLVRIEKKFEAFKHEAELKKHNSDKHGGHMSRSRRNAALQLQAGFRFGSSHDEEASLETQNSDANTTNEASSSTMHSGSSNLDTSDIDPLVKPCEIRHPTDADSRYLQALWKASGKVKTQLEDSSLFPSLAPGSSNQPQPSTKHESDHGFPNKTSMAAHLRRQNNHKVTDINKPDVVISPSQAWPTVGRVAPSTSSPQTSWPKPNVSAAPPTSSPQTSWAKSYVGVAPSPKVSVSGQNKAWPKAKVSGCGQNNIVFTKESGHSSHQATSTELEVHKCVSLDSRLDFPTVSAAQAMPKAPQKTSHPQMEVGDFEAANEALVEDIRAALGFDEHKYTEFKDKSLQYSQGKVDIQVYLDIVRQFGMLHLVLDLARLCPNAQKQRELIDAYNNSMRSNDSGENNGWSHTNVRSKNLKKSKGKNFKIGLLRQRF